MGFEPLATANGDSPRQTHQPKGPKQLFKESGTDYYIICDSFAGLLNLNPQKKCLYVNSEARTRDHTQGKRPNAQSSGQSGLCNYFIKLGTHFILSVKDIIFIYMKIFI